jgi:hypothetical protein
VDIQYRTQMIHRISVIIALTQLLD